MKLLQWFPYKLDELELLISELHSEINRFFKFKLPLYLRV